MRVHISSECELFPGLAMVMTHRAIAVRAGVEVVVAIRVTITFASA